MKKEKNICTRSSGAYFRLHKKRARMGLLFIFVIPFLWTGTGMGYLSAQDSTAAKKTIQRVDNTFASNYLIDNQTVDVNALHTLEFGIQHRFGTTNNGYSDFFGILSSYISFV